jgi:hypothetical protein
MFKELHCKRLCLCIKLKFSTYPSYLGKKNGLHDNIQAPNTCCQFHVKTIIPTMFLKTQIFLINKSFFLLHWHYTLKVHKSGIFGQCLLVHRNMNTLISNQEFNGKRTTLENEILLLILECKMFV